MRWLQLPLPNLHDEAPVAQAPPSPPRKVFCSRDELEMTYRGHGEYSCPRCDARKHLPGDPIRGGD